MRSLDRTLRRAQTPFVTTGGARFFGTMTQAGEGAVPPNTFLETRLLLRVHPATPVRTGEMVRDQHGRLFLVAEHDINPIDRVHKLFLMTDQVSWGRMQSGVDLITGLPKATTEQNLGPIWCALETYGREEIDFGLRASEERNRIITGSPVLLGDQVNGAIAKRVWKVYGVVVAEIQ